MRVLPLGEKLTIAIDLDGTVADCTDVDFDKVDKDPNELMKAFTLLLLGSNIGVFCL